MRGLSTTCLSFTDSRLLIVYIALIRHNAWAARALPRSRTRSTSSQMANSRLLRPSDALPHRKPIGSAHTTHPCLQCCGSQYVISLLLKLLFVICCFCCFCYCYCMFIIIYSCDGNDRLPRWPWRRRPRAGSCRGCSARRPRPGRALRSRRPWLFLGLPLGFG